MTKNDFYTAILEADSAFSREKAFCFTQSKYAKEQLMQIKQRAEEYLVSPIPTLPFSLFRQYSETGERFTYESAYFEKRGRLLCFTICLWQNPQNITYKTALEDIIWDICAEPFWCIPAHFLGYNEAPLDFEQYETQLDLFASETAFALSECLNLCGNLISSQVCSQVQKQLNNRVFEPFCNGNNFYRFEAMANNWSSVCACAIAGAAIYMVKDINALSSILLRAQSCIDLYLSSFGEDGVCVEGVDYWTYGFGFFVCYADLLCQKTNNKIDLFKDKKVEKISRSFSSFYLNKNSTLSFSDGSENSKYRVGIISYLSKKYDNYLVPACECAADVLSDSCYRFCLAIRDLVWNNENGFIGNTDKSLYFENAKWFIYKNTAYNFAAKGGNNDESHNHNDCGSFILTKNGLQILCDYGAGLYNAEYFGKKRYEIFVNRSSSHNIAMINGLEQCSGTNFYVENETAQDNSFSLNLEKCYNDKTLKAYVRKFVCNDTFVCIEDEFVFSEIGNITEIFVSKEPIILQNGSATFTRENENIILSFDADIFVATTDCTEYCDHFGISRTAYRLLISALNKSAQIKFKAVLQ